jgi:hypothetical protein
MGAGDADREGRAYRVAWLPRREKGEGLRMMSFNGVIWGRSVSVEVRRWRRGAVWSVRHFAVTDRLRVRCSLFRGPGGDGFSQ